MIQSTRAPCRALGLLLFLVGIAMAHASQEGTSGAPDVSPSPFNGAWGGYRNPSPFPYYSEFEFDVTGDRLVGVWHTPKESLALTGSVSGGKVTGQIQGGGAFSLEVIGPQTIKFKKLAFMGSKFELTRLASGQADANQARLRSTSAAEKAAAVGELASMTASLASHDRVSAPVVAPAAVSAQAGSCGSYPVGSRGSHPAGYTCRCSYGGPSNQLGWWAVQPGATGSGTLACGPPGHGTAPVAMSADDENRDEAMRRQIWELQQQRDRDAAAAAKREQDLQRQLASLQQQQAQAQVQQHAAQRPQQAQESKNPPAHPDIQGGGASGQASRNPPKGSPDTCFSHNVVTNGDSGTIVFRNACGDRVYWTLCVNRSTAPWNDYYPGSTPPGGTSEVNMWSPSERTEATFKYNISYDGTQSKPSC